MEHLSANAKKQNPVPQANGFIMPGTIGLRFIIDTSQAVTQVDDLSDSIVKLMDDIRSAEAAAAAGTGSYDTVRQLYQSLNNATAARGNIANQARQAQNNQNNNAFNGQLPWMFQTTLNQITSGIIKSMDAALSAARQRASGDYTGAAVTETRARGELTGQGIGSGVGFGVGAGLTALTGQAWLMPLLSGLGGEIGRFIGGIPAKELEEKLAYSQQYKNALPSIDALNQLYGVDINKKTGLQNDAAGLQMYKNAREKAEGTGLETKEFISAMKQMGAYGIGSEEKALTMTRSMAMWSRFTGADLSAIQKFGGKASRFGGETDAVSTAYGGLMAQNMKTGQFTEFLNSMERILEEGISKGFVRSSEEIAGNMQMLYSLSGGSRLWQGEQGAQRLSQMNNAISNATNLQSVNDVISFGVARDVWGKENKEGWKLGEQRNGVTYTGTYADEMQLLEKGVSAKLLKGQFEAVSRLEGNNNAGIIERFKGMYGLNYAGAAQVWSMMINARDEKGNFNFNEEQFEKQIKEMAKKEEYKSDSAVLKDGLNLINENLVILGQKEFKTTELPMLYGAIQDIRDKYLGITDPTRLDSQQQMALAQATENFTPAYVPDQGTNDSRMIAWRIDMQPFIAGENSANPYLRQAATRFNRSILPSLSERTNVSEDMMNKMLELGEMVRGVQGNRGSNSGMDEARFNTVMLRMDRLTEAIERNTLATNDYSNLDVRVTTDEY